MERPVVRSVIPLLIVLSTSLVLGAFLSRFVAENFYRSLSALYDLVPTLIVTVMVSLVMGLRHVLFSKHSGAADAHLRDALCHLPLLLLALYLVPRHVNTLKATVLLLGTLSLVASLLVAEFYAGKWRDWILLSCVFLLSLALYMKTLAPTVGEHDTFEFQVLSYELGIAHPTGYPLYIMAGKLFTLLPLGNVAFRVNLSSALFAAAAVVVLYLTIHHLTDHRSASALAALAFAFTPSFWSQAVEAEVYALNVLFVAVICYLLLRCFHRPSSDILMSEARSGDRASILERLGHRYGDGRLLLMYAVAFIYGLSLTHHRTMLLLAPAVVIYILVKRPRCLLRVRRLLLLLLAFIVPLLGIYLYIPLRWWQIHDRMMSWTEFTDLVLGSQFAAALRWDAWYRELDRASIYARILLDQYPVPALALALLGLIWLFWPKKPIHRHPTWKEAMFLLMVMAAYAIFGLSYYVPDVSLFIIPSHLIIAICLGMGVAALCRSSEHFLTRFHQISKPMRRTLVRAVVLTLVVTLPLWLIWTNISSVDRSDQYASYEWGTHVLQQELPMGSVILADSDKMAPLHYLQRVEGLRPDTETAVFPDEETCRAELERRVGEGRPVFLARFLPGLETTYHLRSVGPLVEVSRSMLTELPSDLRPAEANFESMISLRGYRLDSMEGSATDPVRLTLYWQTHQSVRQNYDVQIRLVGQRGRVWHQTKGRPPVNGLYPTAVWRPGEIVPDYHELDLPESIPPGEYLLQVGLFPPFSQDALTPVGEDDDYLTLSTLSVSPAVDWSPTPQHQLRMNFDGRIMLLGYDFPATVTPTQQASLTLYWQRIGQIQEDYNLVLELAAATGNVLWRSVELPLLSGYPTSHWAQGQTLADVHHIPIPPDSAGQLQLIIALHEPQTMQPVPVVEGWLGSRKDRTVLTTVEAQQLPHGSMEHENLPANFGNVILLLDYEVHNVQVRKGGGLQLTLTWQALTPVDKDYTVFVHILDENEQIWGQEDIQPVYGTHPTSRWREREAVLDSHTVWTDERAPLGLYQIEVGMYLLRTMERLQVLDSSGVAIGDRVIIDLMEIVP